MMDPPPVENNSVDAIANELIKDDLRSFVGSIYTAMNLTGGDKAVDFFFEEVAQFVDQTTCPTDIDIEKVADEIPFEFTTATRATTNDVIDYCKSFADTSYENMSSVLGDHQQDDQQQEDRDVSWDRILDQLFTDSGPNAQDTRGAPFSSTKNMSGGHGEKILKKKKKKTKKRLNGKMLDALAKMMDEIPDATKQGQDTTIPVTRSSSNDPTVEEMSTMAFPGDHHHGNDAVLVKPTTEETPDNKAGNGLTKGRMEKLNFVKSMSIRARGGDKQKSDENKQSSPGGSPFRSLSSSSLRRNNKSVREESNEFAKIRGLVSSKQEPFIAEDDWEYLEEETLSSNVAGPIIASKGTSCGSGDKDNKKKSPSKVWRRMSTSLVGKSKKNHHQFGRYRSFLRREDKISFDDDGSVQVQYHGKVVDPAKESIAPERRQRTNSTSRPTSTANKRPIEVQEVDSFDGARGMPTIQLPRLRTTLG